MITLSQLQNTKQNYIKPCQFRRPILQNSYDSVSFGSQSENLLKNAINFAQKHKGGLARQYKNCSMNLETIERLEGIQTGIDVFKDLSLKEILFSLNNIYGLAATRGCYNHCAHCYASAPPMGRETGTVINRMSYEDFNKLFSGIDELTKRLGFSPINNQEVATFFDSDSMNTILHDKFGKEYDFTDIAKLIKEKSGKTAQFNTAGWNLNDKKAQAHAEKYAQYFADDENKDKIYKFIISFNPYQSIYAKAMEQLQKGDLANYIKLRDVFIKRMANVLYTFTPLVDKKFFKFITITESNEIPGFKKADLIGLKNNIAAELERRYQNNDNLGYIKSPEDIKEYCQKFAEKMLPKNRSVSTPLIIGRYADFLKHNKIKFKKEKPYEFELEYDIQKVINSNGEVFMYPDYTTLYKTGIKFNFDNKNKETIPFNVPIEDYGMDKHKLDYAFSID